MIPSLIKKRNIAAGLTVALYGAIFALKSGGMEDIVEVLVWPTVLAMIAACWFYLKAKKRSGIWLILLPMSVIAFLIYWSLEDRSEIDDEVPCGACGAKNFAGDPVCRLCKSTMGLT